MMLLRKIILLFFVFFITASYAQRRKKVDTVYVYEKVIVYDTVFFDKPFKSKSNGLVFAPLKINHAEIRGIYKEKTDKQERSKKIKKESNSGFQYGAETGISFKTSEWAKRPSQNKPQFGENIGFWISKNVFTPPLSVMLSATIYYWNSPFDLDANKEDTFLNGYYFKEHHQPLLFQRFNSGNLDYAFQLKLFYEWKKFRPFAGFLINMNRYEMQFLVPENNVLSRLEDFKSSQTALGFSAGLQYRISSRFLINLEYQQYQLKNVSMKSNSFELDILKPDNTFFERKVSLGISCFISK